MNKNGFGGIRERIRQGSVNRASHAAARAVQAQIDAGEQPPYVAHAHVRGMNPVETAAEVGQKVIDIIGGEVSGPRYFVDEQSVATEEQRVRVGAMIRIYPVEQTGPRVES